MKKNNKSTGGDFRTKELLEGLITSRDRLNKALNREDNHYDLQQKEKDFDALKKEHEALKKRNGELVKALKAASKHLNTINGIGLDDIDVILKQALKNNKCTHEEIEMSSATVGVCENCNKNINLLGK